MTKRSAPRTVVIGAGIGGLTAAAMLLRAGHQVTVLESQIYAGGSAGTYTYQGYRFDAGATLAGGFNEGGPHWQVSQALGIEWPIKPVGDAAWTVHLPDGQEVVQWTDEDAWRAERQQAFPTGERFWRRQEMLADTAWDVSSRNFPWPPQTAHELRDLALAIRPRTLRATPYILRSVADMLPEDERLRLFVDANLLISAQTTSEDASALYGSAALDLPRRGVNHVRGGIGSLATTLVEWIRDNGGEVLFRQTVSRIDAENGRAVRLHTNEENRRRHGRTFEFDYLVANLTPWTLAHLLEEQAPNRLRNELQRREATWGAFMLYIGARADKLPQDSASHHQIIADASQPLGETNSIFVSMSDPADPDRAPDGMRAVNISTHTDISQWWRLRDDPDAEQAYLEKRERYVERMIALADSRIPGFKAAAELVLPATPVTYQTWTGRARGMVGGFAQTSIFDARGPWTGLNNAWLVGDSVFPGQSTAGVTLSGMRVARAVQNADQTLRLPALFRMPQTWRAQSSKAI